MASLFKRHRSPYWWIKYKNHLGKIVRESTGFKVGIGQDTRRARELCAERSLAETKVRGLSTDEYWNAWVPNFIKVKHGARPRSLERYQGAWRNLSTFFTDKEVLAPRHLTRAHCIAYIDWRQSSKQPCGMRKVRHNTALMEIKILATIMAEAVQRNYAPFNPCRDLKIGKAPVKEYSEYTDDDLEFIQEKILAEPDGDNKTFLARSFLISRYQGCRIAETHLNPLTQVNLREGQITFMAKRGKVHLTQLHPRLVPLFKELVEAGASETYKKPPNPSRNWWNFLTRIGLKKKLPNGCFHSLRVTAATRMARNKQVKEADAMRFLGHASVTVHRAYQRLRVDDLSACVNALDDKPVIPKIQDSHATKK